MKIALMQPYFFPYIGYFQLIKSVDQFIIFDNAQYVKRSWMNRNRILNEHKESVFINIPVNRVPRETKIKEIQINNKLNWQRTILNQLLIYKKAPNYSEVMKLVEECISKSVESLSLFNTNILKAICSVLEIETYIAFLSEQFPGINSSNESDEWGLQVSLASHATSYINAIGGKEFYNPKKYLDNNIEIKFIKSNRITYNQFGKNFVSNLSIIDILMFNSQKNILDMLNNYELIN